MVFRMRTHIVMPFSRPENIPTLRKMFEDQKADLVWHPICQNAEHFSEFYYNPRWINPTLKTPPASCDVACWKINDFLAGELVDGDRYCFPCDDTVYEPGFFSKLNLHPGEVVICSISRGHHAIPNHSLMYSGRYPNHIAHPAGTVLASPENMKIGISGMPQIFVSGKVARTVRFEERLDADGVMIEYLAANYSIDYAPECWVWWNYLQPGRYDK